MKNQLLKRIEELGQEASKLLHVKTQYQAAIAEIDTRMHQIAGAIMELDAIVKGETSEARTNSEQGNSGASKGSDGEEATR
jgi:hypothetical protein